MVEAGVVAADARIRLALLLEAQKRASGDGGLQACIQRLGFIEFAGTGYKS
ncbi:MAG: hypothetical protein ACOC1F_03615 [Myxococcota bacterium]